MYNLRTCIKLEKKRVMHMYPERRQPLMTLFQHLSIEAWETMAVYFSWREILRSPEVLEKK